MWKYEVKENELIRAVCFGKNDRKVLVAVVEGGLCTLRLLDSATGAEERKIAIPGDLGRCPSSSSIVMVNEDFIVLTARQDTSSLLYVQTDPWAASLASFHEFPGQYLQSLAVSNDQTRLVAFGTESYHAMTQQNNAWLPWLDGSADGAWVNNGSRFTEALFSPDSKYLYVASETAAKVIDVASKKVVRELSQGCEAAAFSPDGSLLIGSDHSGMSTWDAISWEMRPSANDRHDCPVIGVRFLPDGKTVLSHDHNGFIVWDLPTRKARAVLKGRNDEMGSQIRQFALASNAREIIASDGRDYLRWRLPDTSRPVPTKPEVHIGISAFGEVASSDPNCSVQDVHSNLLGNQFLTVTKQGTQWRDAGSPSRVKTLTSVQKAKFGPECHVTFLTDGQLCLHAYDDRIYHLDVSSDRLTEVAALNDTRAEHLWLPQRQCYVAMTRNSIQFVNAITGQVVKSLAKPPGGGIYFGQIFRGGFGVAVSKDEKTAAVYMQTDKQDLPLLTLWDIDSGKMLGRQDLPLLDVHCMDLSPDGSILAVGHKNTAVSLWDMRMLRQGGSSASATEPAKNSSQMTPRKPAYQLVTSSVLPSQSLPDDHGGRWKFAPDGSLSIESSLPSFGSLSVNGSPFTRRTSRYMQRHGDEKVAMPFFIGNEGEIGENGLWVRRSLELHALSGLYQKTMVQAVDGLTNTTSAPVKADIVFGIRFPEQSQGLLKNADQYFQIPADGWFKATSDQSWIAAAGIPGKGEPVAAVRVQAQARMISPSMHWDDHDKSLALHYCVTIPPGETRWMVHGVALVHRFKEGSLNAIQGFPSNADVGYYVPPGNRHEGMNFCIPDLWNPEHNNGILPSSMLWSSALPKPNPVCDNLGFGWEPKYDRGRLGELGATGILEVWSEGHPAFAAGFSQLFYRHVDGNLKIPGKANFSDSRARVHVTRRDSVTNDGLATIWHDEFFSNAQEPTSKRISYITTFKSPVIEIWDAKGKRYAPSDLVGSAANLGGACAFVLEGDLKPATLIAFHREGAPLAPSIRWLGAQAVMFEYDLKMQPGQTVCLIHGANQRPLTAFSSPAEAFADWLPLTLPPTPDWTSTAPSLNF